MKNISIEGIKEMKADREYLESLKSARAELVEDYKTGRRHCSYDTLLRAIKSYTETIEEWERYFTTKKIYF